MSLANDRPVVVILGASGFVGSGLVPKLARHAHSIRCVSRDPKRITGRLPGQAIRMRADLLDEASLDRVLAGADVVYYLAHALSETESFSDLEERSAINFARAAGRAGIRRIVYLGALAQVGEQALSEHISSRHRVGEILRASGVPVTEFRASVVIGAGSMPFEVVRALVERLPVMVTPRWVRMPIQPIAEADLHAYLVAALGESNTVSHVFEIGGKTVVDYGQLMSAYARARGLRRRMIPVPVITPRLSSLWLKLVTPAHFRMGRRIVDSAEHSSVVVDDSAREAFDIRPMGLEDAVNRALSDERRDLDELELGGSEDDGESGALFSMFGSRFIERRVVDVSAGPDACFDVISRIGGETGWYFGDWLWRLRGLMDQLVGGPGMRRGRPTRRPLAVGDPLDFWTVSRFEPGERLTLRAEMKLPGVALLDLRVRPSAEGCRIVQTASFDARGIPGMLYWLALQPLHGLVFDGMLRGIARAAEERAGAARSGTGRSRPYDLSRPAADGASR